MNRLMEVDNLIKVTLTNEILKRISEIDENRFSLSTIELPPVTKNRLRKNSKKKTSPGHASCPAIAGMIKCMEVECKLALPKEAWIRFE